MNTNTYNIGMMILERSMIFHFNHVAHTVEKDSELGIRCLQALQSNRIQDIPFILDKIGSLENAVGIYGFSLVNGMLFRNDVPVPSYISKKVIEFYEQQLPYIPLLNMCKRLENNPSPNSREQVYNFLESCQCAILENGCFIGYKGVQPTEKEDVVASMREISFLYTLGEYRTMPREQVEDNPNASCGPGLHVGSRQYAIDWGPLVLEVIVDPADVVSVPKDIGCQKMRCWRLFPVTTHVGSGYKGGIATEATPEEDNSIVLVSNVLNVSNTCDSTSSAKEGTFTSLEAVTLNTSAVMLINNIKYNQTVIPESLYNALVPVSMSMAISNCMRYRASKAPAALQRSAAQDSSKLIEAYKFTFDGEENPIFVFKTDSTLFPCYLVYPETMENPEVITSLYNKSAVDFTKPLSKVEKVVGTFTYANALWRICKIVDNPESVQNYVEAFPDTHVRSFIHLKPSKLPVGFLKELAVYGWNASDVKRVTLQNEKVIFFMHVTGSSTGTALGTLMLESV